MRPALTRFVCAQRSSKPSSELMLEPMRDIGSDVYMTLQLIASLLVPADAAARRRL